MRFLEAIEGFGGIRVGRFVWMDEERLVAVGLFDVRFGDARGEIEEGIGIKLEDAENTIDFCILGAVSIGTH